MIESPTSSYDASEDRRGDDPPAPVHRMAYHTPLMALYNGFDSVFQDMICDQLRVVGVRNGTSKDATPDQRYAVLRWAVEKFPQRVRVLPGLPKDLRAMVTQEPEQDPPPSGEKGPDVRPYTADSVETIEHPLPPATLAKPLLSEVIVTGIFAHTICPHGKAWNVEMGQTVTCTECDLTMTLYDGVGGLSVDVTRKVVVERTLRRVINP